MKDKKSLMYIYYIFTVTVFLKKKKNEQLPKFSPHFSHRERLFELLRLTARVMQAAVAHYGNNLNQENLWAEGLISFNIYIYIKLSKILIF